MDFLWTTTGYGLVTGLVAVWRLELDDEWTTSGYDELMTTTTGGDTASSTQVTLTVGLKLRYT